MRLQGFNISPIDINLLDHWFDSPVLGLIQFMAADKGIAIKMMIIMVVIVLFVRLNRGVVVRALAIPQMGWI